MYARHKKAVIWHKIAAFAGYVRVNTGRVQSLQMPVISLTLYCKCLTLYCKCLRCDRSLFTVDGYGVGSCKSQGILRPSSARPSSLTSDDRPMFEIKESSFFYSIANYSQSWEAEWPNNYEGIKDCELFAPSALIQSCAWSSVTSYALGLQ
jgi:hypothetical protein